MDDADKDWKLKLRYGQITTPYEHFTVIADGTARDIIEDFSCPDGKAYFGMKVWASSTGEAADMIKVIGEQVGFTVTGKIEVFDSAPEQPPRENPYGYDIQFTPYK
jgi:hypothetical protein